MPGFLLQGLYTYGPRTAVALIILLLSLLCSSLIARFLQRIGSKFDKGKRQVLTLSASTSRILILILGTITALGTLGVNVSALVAGLGLSGFALGFALKDALSNLLSGALILIYQPFSTGDRISAGASEGEIIEINLRYTVLQGKDRKYLIPNSSLFTTQVAILTNNAS